MKSKKLSCLEMKIVSSLLMFSLVLSSFAFGVFAAKDSEISFAEEAEEQGTVIARPDREELMTALLAEMTEQTGIFKYVDRASFAAAGHIQRLPEEESLNSYVFRNADGTRSVYILEESVKYIDKTGVIREKDLTLRQNADGSYNTAANDTVLTLPKNSSLGVTLKTENGTIRLVPKGSGSFETMAQPGTAEVQGQNFSAAVGSAAVVLQNNAAFYAAAFGSGTSLRYTPTLNGVKEDVILARYTGVNRFMFTLTTGELSVFEDENGYYIARCAEDEARILIGNVWVYDSSDRFEPGLLSVVRTAQGTYTVTVGVSTEFLTDKKTVYPVYIDPTLTVSDPLNGANSIEDATVFAGLPNYPCGDMQYCTVGDSAEYGVGRTAVRLPGLLNSSIYRGIAPEQVNSLKFYVKEASGGAALSVSLYQILSPWSEASLTWGTLGSVSSTAFTSGTLKNNAWTGFELSSAYSFIKGTQAESCGFLMKADDETVIKKFCGSEYAANESYRPYVVLDYWPYISIQSSDVTLLEGERLGFSVTTYPGDCPVQWSSDNPDVVTVDYLGRTTACKAGVAHIIASVIGNDGIAYRDTCQVTVCIRDGVYYIKNAGTDYCVHVPEGSIEDQLATKLYSKYPDSESANHKIQQMFRIRYLGNGQYSIRLMYKSDMGLCVGRMYPVRIGSIGTEDTLAAVPANARWVIEWESSGYILRNVSDGGIMQVYDRIIRQGADIYVRSERSTNNSDYWELSKISNPPTGAYLYNVGSRMIVQNPKRCVLKDKTCTMESMDLAAFFYSETLGDQDFLWSSSNTNVAAVDSETGAVTGVSFGKATISGIKVYGNIEYTVIFEVEVVDIRVADVEVLYDYAYLKRYPDAYDRIIREMEVLKEKYLREYGILIEYTDPVLNISLGDLCAMDSNYEYEWSEMDPDEGCHHASDEDCKNSKGQQVYQLHHKNLNNILYDYFELKGKGSTILTVYYIGHKTCREGYDSSGKHRSGPNGATAEQSVCGINNFGPEESETRTLIHEFDHTFMLEDHYNQEGYPSTEEKNNSKKEGSPNFSKFCIHGEYYSGMNGTFMQCDGCREVIINHRLSHTRPKEEE